MKTFDLTGKAALVTGGNGGIGLAMAQGLARAGASVAIAGRDERKNQAALRELGEGAIALRADLGDERACRGMVQLTRSLACAWAKDNIQVNAVLPGWIDTALTRRAREEVAGLHERVLARTPAGRWGEPADLAGIAVFLASSASDFITGAAIPVDGGYSIQG